MNATSSLPPATKSIPASHVLDTLIADRDCKSPLDTLIDELGSSFVLDNLRVDFGVQSNINELRVESGDQRALDKLRAYWGNQRVLSKLRADLRPKGVEVTESLKKRGLLVKAALVHSLLAHTNWDMLN
jgi:hypothetical protein